jgi:hypothetical protein
MRLLGIASCRNVGLWPPRNCLFPRWSELKATTVTLRTHHDFRLCLRASRTDTGQQMSVFRASSGRAATLHGFTFFCCPQAERRSVTDVPAFADQAAIAACALPQSTSRLASALVR